MKSLSNIPYFILVTAAVAIVWGFFAFLFFAGSAVHYKAAWVIFGFYTLMCILGIVVHGVLSPRSRGLGYSATVREYNTASNLAGVSAPVRVKLPLHWALVLFLLIEIALAFWFYALNSHGAPVDGRFWFLLVVNTAAVVVIACRFIMRRFTRETQPRVRTGTQMENRTGIAILFGMAGTVVGACVSSFLITGHWLYPPTTPPADARHIYGFAALSGFICVFAAMRLIKRGEIRI